MYRLVLFDLGGVLVSDDKDVSEYVAESIRNIYGRIVTVDLTRYAGWTSQETVEDVLRRDNMAEPEIQARLPRIMEDLYYTYYNVAGHDRQHLRVGARELLAHLWKRDAHMGILTGEAERIAKLRAEKTGIHGFFKTGAYGNDGKRFEEIAQSAARRAGSELGIGKGEIAVVAGSVHLARGAKAAGLAVIGVAGAYTEEELKGAGADITVKDLGERSKISKFLGI